jgi:D-glycero-alpha-D-manno-heptose-7-phosphate kinase
MILTRTPLRISLFGGGSDIPDYYHRASGAVLSTSINKYMYIALCKTAYEGIKLVYNDIETVLDVEHIKHTRVKECLKAFNVSSNVEISSFCEIPTKGTGLGSSSTFTVGLINALKALKNVNLNKRDIAEMACDVEIYKCNEPIGKQDQYAAAFGGMKFYKFYSDKIEVIEPVVSQKTLDNLNNNLLLFYTGITRSTTDILNSQKKNKNKNRLIDTMVTMAYDAYAYLKNDDCDSVGQMLDEAWALKRQLSSDTSNKRIDHYYNLAMKAGALGGKLLGAGGGGYLLFYVPDNRKKDVLIALDDLMTFDFKFENSGTTVVYNESK